MPGFEGRGKSQRAHVVSSLVPAPGMFLVRSLFKLKRTRGVALASSACRAAQSSKPCRSNSRPNAHVTSMRAAGKPRAGARARKLNKYWAIASITSTRARIAPR
eukprot:4920307-Pyramimonas_sp.AAC.1